MSYLVPQSGYSAREEKLNVLLHGFGLFATMAAGLYLLSFSWPLAGLQKTGLMAYWFSLLAMFATSTLYHALGHTQLQTLLKRLDHCAIYGLIAGTYTAIIVLGIQTPVAWRVVIFLWIMVALGGIFKLFFVHRFGRLSLAIYLAMGWSVVFFWRDAARLSPDVLYPLLAGGISYTLGTLFYASKKIPYTHAIWHAFVLVAAGLQALAVVRLLPAP